MYSYIIIYSCIELNIDKYNYIERCVCVYIYVFLYPSFSICKNNDLVSPRVLWRLNTLCIPSPRCLGQSPEQSVTERCAPPNKPEV